MQQLDAKNTQAKQALDQWQASSASSLDQQLAEQRAGLLSHSQAQAQSVNWAIWVGSFASVALAAWLLLAPFEQTANQVELFDILLVELEHSDHELDLLNNAEFYQWLSQQNNLEKQG